MSVTSTAAWRPEPGDNVTGEITDLSEHNAGYGVYPILEMTLADGSILMVHAFHEVLQSELAKGAPAIGDEITITYLGRHEKGYHLYKVRRPAGGAPAINWSRYGATEADSEAGSVESAGNADDSEWRQPRDEGDDVPF